MAIYYERQVVRSFAKFFQLMEMAPHAGFQGARHDGAVRGGGVRGGTVIGATDRIAAYPTSDGQTPENVAATIYHTLGLPRTTAWRDVDGRPYELYTGDPIPRLK
jgi:hypothetical protein